MTAQPTVKLEFNPDPKEDKDTIKLTIDDGMKDLLNRVVSSKKNTQRSRIAHTEFVRPKLKKFITEYHKYFVFLWAGELLDKSEFEFQGTYSEYLEIMHQLKHNNFKTLCTELANYKKKSFEISVNTEPQEKDTGTKTEVK